MGARHGDDERFAAGCDEDWVESQARGGRYSNASDYVRDLIRRDRERAEQRADLQCLITQGIESGVSDRTMEELLEAARARAGSPRE